MFSILNSSWHLPRVYKCNNERRQSALPMVYRFCCQLRMYFFHLFSKFFLVWVLSQASYLVFHRYEPQSVLNVSCLIFLLPATATWFILPSPLTLEAIKICVSYWFLLLTFIVVYRLSPFHPLSNIPGPLIYKITKLRVAYSIAKGNRHILHHQLHLKYGDMVRIGTVVSFIDPCPSLIWLF
jgi:hypothetical protein